LSSSTSNGSTIVNTPKQGSSTAKGRESLLGSGLHDVGQAESTDAGKNSVKALLRRSSPVPLRC
jgi:hypothetical protein